MAFTPSYNILDKDTHNTLVEALKSGGIGYTEADGTVHKISDTYASGGGSSLPEVSADDNGDVLTVVSGEWAKAAPSGGGGVALVEELQNISGVAVGTGDEAYSATFIFISDEDFAKVANGAFPVLVQPGSLKYPTRVFFDEIPFLASSESVARELNLASYLAEDIELPITWEFLVGEGEEATALVPWSDNDKIRIIF